jgi:succinyl-CoA synthetase beta subunit
MTGGSDIVAVGLRHGQTALSEADSKRVLAGYGIPVIREEQAASADEAVAAATRIGYPVVLKGCHWTLQHKTEMDMVRLSLADEAALRAACAELQPRLPAGGFLLVQEMVSGRRELLCGVIRDPQFGPCVSVGIGGIFAEVLQDVSFRVAPFDRLEAAAMLSELKSGSLLGSFRGMPPVDMAALERLLVGLSRLAVEVPAIREIDVNPVIIAGNRPVAVDALIVLA